MTVTSALWVCTAPIGRADKKTSPELIAADAIVRIFAEETDLDSPEPRRGFLSANVRGLAGGTGVVDLCQGYGLDLTHEAPTRLATMIAQHCGDAGIIYIEHGTAEHPPAFDFQLAGQDTANGEARS